jgi:hypothetical protein
VKVKQGASIEGCRGPILIALIKIEPLFTSRGIEMVITSGTDGKHNAERSSHYRGDGADLRSRDLANDPLKWNLARAIRRKLGPDFVVLVESNHFHLHYSPVYNL